MAARTHEMQSWTQVSGSPVHRVERRGGSWLLSPSARSTSREQSTKLPSPFQLTMLPFARYTHNPCTSLFRNNTSSYCLFRTYTSGCSSRSATCCGASASAMIARREDGSSKSPNPASITASRRWRSLARKHRDLPASKVANCTVSNRRASVWSSSEWAMRWISTRPWSPPTVVRAHERRTVSERFDGRMWSRSIRVQIAGTHSERT